MNKGTRLIAGMGMLCLVAGCKTADDYKEERYSGSTKTINEINQRYELKEGDVLSLQTCVDLAVTHNLDLATYKAQLKVADGRTAAEWLGMLPDLTVSNDFTDRSNYSGSESTGVGGGSSGNSGATRSSDKYENQFKVELALSALDFGMAYLNAMQSEDRALIVQEQQRRAEQNLRLDVARAYFRVAATQDAIDSTAQLLEECRGIDLMLEELAKTNQIDHFRIIDEQRRFIRMERQLREYTRNYKDACVDLRSLMGLAPGGDIRVDAAPLRAMYDLDLPEIDVLEKIALVERPELYQMDIQTHITVNEARKSILMMFPSVRAVTDFTNSSNPFLYNQSWWEVAIKASYNLLKLPQQIAIYRQRESEVDELELRKMALAIGVMSQVRIAHANLLEVKSLQELNERNYRNYAKGLDIALQDGAGSGALSKLNLDALRMEEVQAKIDAQLSLGSYYVAYYQLQNAVGISDFTQPNIERIALEIAQAEARERSAEEESKAAQLLADNYRTNNAVFNGVKLGHTTMDNSTRAKYADLLPKAE